MGACPVACGRGLWIWGRGLARRPALLPLPIQARIKKIMQTDEEIGKVAAAVPVIICILMGQCSLLPVPVVPSHVPLSLSLPPCPCPVVPLSLSHLPWATVPSSPHHCPRHCHHPLPPSSPHPLPAVPFPVLLSHSFSLLPPYSPSSLSPFPIPLYCHRSSLPTDLHSCPIVPFSVLVSFPYLSSLSHCPHHPPPPPPFIPFSLQHCLRSFVPLSPPSPCPPPPLIPLSSPHSTEHPSLGGLRFRLGYWGVALFHLSAPPPLYYFGGGGGVLNSVLQHGHWSSSWNPCCAKHVMSPSPAMPRP